MAIEVSGSAVTVAVIGAGPAGIALGRQLRTRDVPCVILDRGNVGASWEHMPRHLKLISPWNCNYIHPADKKMHRSGAVLGAGDFQRYLRNVSTANALPVVTNCEVLSVEHDGTEFTLKTSCGAMSSAIVVNATGYFANPRVPCISGDEQTHVPRIHFAQYRDPKSLGLGPGATVLVVGSRLSAGQAALELFDAGFSVSISHRSPLRFGVDDWIWPVVRRTFRYAEAIRLRFGLGGARLGVPMQGGRIRKLIRRGAISTCPAISRFADRAVVFEDGKTIVPALVLYATGFAPALDHLEALNLEVDAESGLPLTSYMESLPTPNLFFLGLDMLCNFQSRFLRGIRNDAVVLAGVIEQRLAMMPEACAGRAL